jgi:diaminopropionate ammonia-lyase
MNEKVGEVKTQLFLNDMKGELPAGSLPSRNPLEYHERLPGYGPSPLVDADALAQELGLKKVWIKDESSRLGLPSFKILGASWGVYRALSRRFGDFEPWASIDDVAAQLEPHKPLSLVAATDGNHGRAVARMAHILGIECSIYVPDGTALARIEGIQSEGATCTVVAGSYDDAVARSAEDASDRCLVISDTSWPGYDEVPRWVIEGYSTIFFEIDNELDVRHEPHPDLVIVQLGVGALGAAAVRHFRSQGVVDATLVGVEPSSAACVFASARAGRMVSVHGPHDSIMAGLNCGTPSLVAWPIVSRGFDAFMAIEDERAREGMKLLARAGVVAGETGAAGVGGLLELLSPRNGSARSHLVLDESTRVLLISTEGATDPDAYERIVGARV